MATTVADGSPKPLPIEDSQAGGPASQTSTKDSTPLSAEGEQNSSAVKLESDSNNVSNRDIQTPIPTQVNLKPPTSLKTEEVEKVQEKEEVEKVREKSGKAEKPQRNASEKRSLPSRKARAEAASKLSSSLSSTSSSKDSEDAMPESDKKSAKRSMKERYLEIVAKRALVSNDKPEGGVKQASLSQVEEPKQPVLSVNSSFEDNSKQVTCNIKEKEKLNECSKESCEGNPNVLPLKDPSSIVDKSPKSRKSEPLKSQASSPEKRKSPVKAVSEPCKTAPAIPVMNKTPKIILSPIRHVVPISPQRLKASYVVLANPLKNVVKSPKADKASGTAPSQPSEVPEKKRVKLTKQNENTKARRMNPKEKSKAVYYMKPSLAMNQQSKKSILKLRDLTTKKKAGVCGVKVISRTVSTQTDEDNPLLFKPLILKIFNSNQKLQVLSGFSSFEVLDSLTDATLKMITNNQTMISDLGPCLREWIIITCMKFLLNLSTEVVASLFELESEECNQIVQKTSRFLRKSLVLPSCQSFVRDMPLPILNGIADCTDMQENGSR